MLDTPIQHKQQPVEEVHFHFIDFDEITDFLPKLAQAYPHTSVSCKFVYMTWFCSSLGFQREFL